MQHSMDKQLKSARLVANLLDRQFKIGSVSFGIESFLGFIPFIGDILGILLALYIYRIGVQAGLPRKHRIRMLFHIFLDFFVGLIPFIGDIFDIAFKANVKNLEILERHMRGKFVEGEVVK